MIVATIEPYGNSEDELIARDDGGRVVLEVTARIAWWNDGKDGDTRVIELAAGDVLEIASRVGSGPRVVYSETRVTRVRGGERAHVGDFCCDSSWGGWIHREIVERLAPVAAAAGATIAEKTVNA